LNLRRFQRNIPTPVANNPPPSTPNTTSRVMLSVASGSGSGVWEGEEKETVSPTVAIPKVAVAFNRCSNVWSSIVFWMVVLRKAKGSVMLVEVTNALSVLASTARVYSMETTPLSALNAINRRLLASTPSMVSAIWVFNSSWLASTVSLVMF